MSEAPQADSRSPKRRRFTARYKEQVLARLESLQGRGAASAYLKEEGLYWSHVAKWRRQRDIGELEDSWTEPAVRLRIQTLIEERTELLREIEDLAASNRELRAGLGLEDEPPSQDETDDCASA